jgi:hypothetical protein
MQDSLTDTSAGAQALIIIGNTKESSNPRINIPFQAMTVHAWLYRPIAACPPQHCSRSATRLTNPLDALNHQTRNFHDAVGNETPKPARRFLLDSLSSTLDK